MLKLRTLGFVYRHGKHGLQRVQAGRQHPVNEVCAASKVGKATLNSDLPGALDGERGSGTAIVMPISPFISFRP